MLELSAQITVGPALNLITGLAERAKDLTPVWLGGVKPSLDRFFEEQFATNGNAGGFPWPPLTDATLAAKARLGRGNMGILRLFDRLWASLVKPTPGNAGISAIGGQGTTTQVYVRGTAVQSDTGFPYALAHQSGFTVSGWGRAQFAVPKIVPPRILIPPVMPAPLIEQWAQMMRDYIVEGAPPS